MVKRRELEDLRRKINRLYELEYASRGIGLDHIKMPDSDGNVMHVGVGAFVGALLEFLGLEVEVVEKVVIRPVRTLGEKDGKE